MDTERNIILSTFIKICVQFDAWMRLQKDARDAMIRRLERSCLNKVIAECESAGIMRKWDNIKFRMRYSAECARIISALDCNSQFDTPKKPWLIYQLVSDIIHPINVASMTNHALCPEASATERQLIDARTKQVIVQKISHMYKCNKCGCKETVFQENQTRAADEAGTIRVKCIRCPNVWNG